MITPRTVFRIIYGASYTILYTILIILLLVSPGDTVYQSWKSGQKNNIWIVTVVYFLTMGIMGFIYITRLYINKTTLSAIPKTWMPVDKADVKLPCRHFLCFAAPPRHEISGSSTNIAQPVPIATVASHDSGDHGYNHHHINLSAQKLRAMPSQAANQSHTALEIPASAAAIWDSIEHPGWSSPNATQMPDVQYSVVCRELPGLVEAKALTLAPTDTTFASDMPMLHPRAVAVLQRPENMSLRDYITHLVSYNVIPQSPSIPGFLARYEQAKYSTRPMCGADFHEMLAHFTHMLQVMRPLDLALLDDDDDYDGQDNGSLYDEDDEDDDNASFHSSLSSTSRNVRYIDAIDDENLSTVPSIRSTISYSDNGSVRYPTRLRPPTIQRNGGGNSVGNGASFTASSPYLSAPMPAASIRKKPSIESFRQARLHRLSRASSAASLQSKASFLTSSSVLHQTTSQ